MNASASSDLLGAVLAASVAAVLVLPKLLLLEYSNRRMGPRHGLGASCLILGQDLLSASVICAGVALSGYGSTFPTAAAGFLVTGACSCSSIRESASSGSALPTWRWCGTYSPTEAGSPPDPGSSSSGFSTA